MNDIPSQKRKRAQSLVGTSGGRPADDWYPTSPEATRAILDQETFTGSIWEPAAGDGAICKVLNEYGYQDILATDLVYRGYGEGDHDFRTSNYKADNIITNPPYNMAQEFIELSLERTTKKVVMLLKLQFLEGQKRKLFYQNVPLSKVYVFSKRVNFYRNGEQGKLGSSMIAFSWHVYDHNYKGKDPVIKWL